MVIIVSGTRYRDLTFDQCKNIFSQYGIRRGQIELIKEGGARGVDDSFRAFCKRYEIPYQTFKADWDKYGKKAGSIRNGEMIKSGGDLLIACPAVGSIGTWDAVRQAADNGMTFRIWRGLLRQ